MVLSFYNTLTKKKEIFKPLKKGEVSMYNCGLTVYDYGHIGNFRAYVFSDILRRYLEYKGFKVKQVMNFTDVGHMTFDEETHDRGEDKMERSAKQKNKKPKEIADFYIEEFLKDSKTLNLLEPQTRPRATEHIKEMIVIIEKLIKNGLAYVTKKGNVYYDIKKFGDYGKLSGNTPDKLDAGRRIRIIEEKKNWYDFALWKRDPNHMIQWDSPWGKGFPGWHIECSAMSMKYLGKTMDIHTGGEDNIFPHHECEISQSEGATGKTFVRYWMHTRHLLVNGKKMSKSKENFYTLRDLLNKDFDPKGIRYLLLSGHYRIRLNFTEKGLKSAEETVKRLEDFVSALRGVKGGRHNPDISNIIEGLKKDFEDAMDDDLNVSLALGKIFDVVRMVNKAISSGDINEKDAKLVLDTMLRFDTVLGLQLDKVEVIGEKVKIKDSDFMIQWQGVAGTEEVDELVRKREERRREKDWKEADGIRDKLNGMGYILEDTGTGVKVKKA